MSTNRSMFEQKALQIGKLVTKKNKAYGDSFYKAEKILKVLYPDGVSPENYRDLLCIVRMIDKFFRIATAKTALDENPFQDIAGYALLAVVYDDLEKLNNSEGT